ncbi:hypothetical protein RRG08_011910 [Elysia crispata]|uniref:Uncharacterized protein n=1 Tax=Elysia crispata TaxID=231223 RepID=A0AAE0ZMN9_9GAST|nr:hypothetical protein RRG08_011910 [Elysia crispata]
MKQCAGIKIRSACWLLTILTELPAAIAEDGKLETFPAASITDVDVEEGTPVRVTQSKKLDRPAVQTEQAGQVVNERQKLTP